jgi:hypothetical protein
MTKSDEELIADLDRRFELEHVSLGLEDAIMAVRNRLRALCDRLEGRGGGEVVAWRWRNPGGVWNYQEDRQRIAKAEHQPLYAGPAPSREGEGGGMADWSISLDGPHKINDPRRIMAKWLMDSKFDDAEAYSCVAYHPAITDRNKALAKAPEASREGEGWRAIESAPRDGTWVVLWMTKPMPHGYASEGPHPVVAKWCRDNGTGPGCWDVPFEDAWFVDADFTHWMPLPAPPPPVPDTTTKEPTP